MNHHTFTAGVLADRAVIVLRGEGCLAFLHNLLTVDMSTPRPAYGALLTPQGKILHDVFVVPEGDRVFVDVAATQAPELLKRLMMYRLRAKFDIALDVSMAVAASPSADLSGLSFADPRLAAMGFRSIVEAGSLPTASGYLATRLAHGLADSQADIGSGEMFIHEANLDQLQGVSFSKGCYVGQEVVSRTHHRHSARNRILPVTFTGSAAHGVDIVSGEQRVGTMLSSRDQHGLALLRLDRLAEATAPLRAGDTPLTVHKPAWMQIEIMIPQETI